MQQSIQANTMTAETRYNRIYESIKAEVTAHKLPSGKRILVEPLADKLFISNTPVREALIQLAAERVIKDVPKAGFFTKEISEPEIRDLYTLSQLLLDWALSSVKDDGQVPGMLKPPEFFKELDQPTKASPQAAVQIMNELFVHISRQSGNEEIIHMIENINDRTYYVRLREYELIGDDQNDLLHLCQTYHRKEIVELRLDLAAYHRKRIDILPDLLRLLRGFFSDTEQRGDIALREPSKSQSRENKKS